MLSRVVPATSLVISAFVADEAIDQRRLADVGAADDGDADAAVFVLLARRHVGKPASTMSMSSSQPHAVRGGDRDAARRDRCVWKSAPAMPPIEALGLVDREEHRLARAPQFAREELVLRREAGARIGDEDEPVGFLDGVLGLDAHQRVHADRVLDQAAGVDADVLHRAELAVAVLAVARDAGHVGHDGVTRLRERVEQRGLADVRPPDDRDDRQHGRLV